ncbi:MAG TPA: hypothetical protein VEA38_03155 [Terriglobales bacterium]|nr:hypothetical protein [Terriglobales bacterium]
MPAPSLAGLAELGLLGESPVPVRRTFTLRTPVKAGSTMVASAADRVAARLEARGWTAIVSATEIASGFFSTAGQLVSGGLWRPTHTIKVVMSKIGGTTFEAVRDLSAAALAESFTIENLKESSFEVKEEFLKPTGQGVKDTVTNPLGGKSPFAEGGLLQIPGWVKWTAIGVVGLYTLAQVATISKAFHGFHGFHQRSRRRAARRARR